MEVTGKVVEVEKLVSGNGANGEWKKRGFVIETQERFPRTMYFVGWKDMADVVGSLNEGDFVNVGVDLKSRKHNDSWYTDAFAWRIEFLSGGTKPKKQEAVVSESSNDDEDDPLPF